MDSECLKLAQKHGIPKTEYNQFEMGMNVEKEHNDITHGNKDMTAKIVMVHLKEDSKYYDKLKKLVEKSK